MSDLHCGNCEVISKWTGDRVVCVGCGSIVDAGGLYTLEQVLAVLEDCEKHDAKPNASGIGEVKARARAALFPSLRADFARLLPQIGEPIRNKKPEEAEPLISNYNAATIGFVEGAIVVEFEAGSVEVGGKVSLIVEDAIVQSASQSVSESGKEIGIVVSCKSAIISC